MAEYIEREVAKKEFTLNFGGVSHAVIANRILDAIPTADVVEVKHGRWESYPSHAYRRCTACKVEFDKPRFNIRANYCPNCGARMGDS